MGESHGRVMGFWNSRDNLGLGTPWRLRQDFHVFGIAIYICKYAI
jgi:hypothetical protein